MNQIVHLKSRAVIKLTGKDAAKFLQSLITNDANKISNSSYIYAFMLTPQGRFLYDFFIIKSGDEILLDCQAAKVTEICAKFQMYKLRSEVEICKTDLQVYASSESFNDQSFIDPRSSALGFRTITSFLEDVNACDDDYHELRIKLLIPDADLDFVYARSLPLNFGESPLNAIDFNKGCYIGQEVTARMSYRDAVRKKLYLLEWSGNPPHKEEELIIKDKKIGYFLSARKNLVLALLNIDEVEMLEKAEYTVNNRNIKIH
ncbi:MAG: aminomethyl transferase family protein [Candidatus Midichloriaceae bacterium]|jgi:folate-binding protein YgfZ|nr:aminomethyl transferase family protein [Candidatus Midichloriaceae bacterium]